MDTQEPILKSKAYNPRLDDGTDLIEFTYDFSSAIGAERPVENIREFTTLGDAKKKQAEDDKYRITLVWFEPNNNVPERLYTMRAGGGDRTVQVTYIHSNHIIGRADYDAQSGGRIDGYIADFAAAKAGRSGGFIHYKCSLTIQEA